MFLIFLNILVQYVHVPVLLYQVLLSRCTGYSKNSITLSRECPFGLIDSFGKKGKKTRSRVGAQGVGTHGRASRIWKRIKICMLMVGGRGPAFKLPDCSEQALSIVQSTAACSTTFRPDLPLPLFHYYTRSPPSLSSKPPPSSRLCVFVFVSSLVCAHLMIYRAAPPAHFASPAAAGYSCCTAELVAPSQPNACWWWRRWCARLPQRFGEWSSRLIRHHRPPHPHAA